MLAQWFQIFKFLQKATLLVTRAIKRSKVELLRVEVKSIHLEKLTSFIFHPTQLSCIPIDATKFPLNPQPLPPEAAPAESLDRRKIQRRR